MAFPGFSLNFAIIIHIRDDITEYFILIVSKFIIQIGILQTITVFFQRPMSKFLTRKSVSWIFLPGDIFFSGRSRNYRLFKLTALVLSPFFVGLQFLVAFLHFKVSVTEKFWALH